MFLLPPVLLLHPPFFFLFSSPPKAADATPVSTISLTSFTQLASSVVEGGALNGAHRVALVGSSPAVLFVKDAAAAPKWCDALKAAMQQQQVRTMTTESKKE